MFNKNRSERFNELKKIPGLAGIDHRHLLNEKGELPHIASLSRNERRKLAKGSKKLGTQYRKILKGISSSGAGFQADQILRQMAFEYTHRYASSGVSNQPISFNYFEPFCNIKLIQKSVAPYMELTDEIDHLFYPIDFFNYLTSSDSDGFHLESLCDLPEAKSFHFTINGDVNDLSFLNAEGREFIASGFSMVRRGNSLHWYLIGGEVLGQEEWDLRCSEQPEIDIEGVAPWKRAFLSEAIEENGNKFGPPVLLDGTKTAIRTVIAGEIDLKTSKHLARCYMAEFEHTFLIFCDDPEVLSGIEEEEELKSLTDNMMDHINKASTMWDLAEGLLQLPHYFKCRITLEKNILVKAGKRLTQKKGGQGINSNYKIVSAIEVTDAEPSFSIQEIRLPHYETETEGHWRRLPKDKIGHDIDGNEVRGKTWVMESNKWKAPAQHSRTIYVKDSLEAAKIKIEEYLKAAEEFGKEKNTVKMQKDAGELYVMRCSAMAEQIYKVGYTSGSSDDRAEQLSAATGVPLSFIVVKSWSHPNAAALETEVHMMLAPYRLNDRREFFQATFKVIENMIESVIARTSTNQTSTSVG